jgi:hypothetical protein
MVLGWRRGAQLWTHIILTIDKRRGFTINMAATAYEKQKDANKDKPFHATILLVRVIKFPTGHRHATFL